jgi:phosphomevalonate kinase
MKVIAPGKLVLTGAYAVLEGAPAIVAAVDRYAVAEVARPDSVDTRALHDEGGRKLGLGSSAASMVASAAARAAARGEDLGDPWVRAALFRRVRDAHARAQHGGSGVDVAAAVHGGTLRYTFAGRDAGAGAQCACPSGRRPASAGPQRDRAQGECPGGLGELDASTARTVTLPTGIELHAFWSGTSARTSDLLARVAALRARQGDCLARLREVAAAAASAVDEGDAPAFVGAARQTGDALEELGRAADAPIVPPAFAALARLAADAGAAFLPSGAGGGDVAVWLGIASPSAPFLAQAGTLGMRALRLSVDRGGVRPLPVGHPSDPLFVQPAPHR